MEQDRAALHARQLARQKKMRQAAQNGDLQQPAPQRQEQPFLFGKAPRAMQLSQQHQNKQPS